ncbi:nucleoside transporter [Apiospora aurea]|uniref:Nucleoside transporter n=1 Tax=Apiospora aurea TaxID=335848 RepID=A0ABR1QCK0_9PEZI
MDRIRSIFKKREDEQEYAPLTQETQFLQESRDDEEHAVPFSWIEYGIFVWLGVAMLWAWNMFLAAAPYFQTRFQESEWILQNFQSALISVSTVMNLLAMIILTNIQYTASYPFRINIALYINVGIFSLLAFSTRAFLDTTPSHYLWFLLAMVACTSYAAGLMQNGVFAFAASFGRPEYMQAIMAGQGIAGVLPPVTQIISVLVAPPSESVSSAPGDVQDGTGNAAFIYFLTAVAISVFAALAFIPLVRRHDHIVEARMMDQMAASFNSVEEAERAARKVVSMVALFKKLHWFASAVFVCFAVTMFFPVFTPKILSTTPPAEADTLLKPAAFIPLAFACWNLGDLGGRAGALVLPYRERPFVLFAVSVARVLFIPLYALCNLHGGGGVVHSDVFYLLLVQFPFGLTNGWLASNCMMAPSEWVEEGEREAAGGFMGLCLVAGLTFGSLLSFTAAGV